MKIIWEPTAEDDLNNIADFIEKEAGPAIALSVLMQIKKHIERLAEFPELGRIGRVEETRELVIPRLPYIAAYWSENGILRVLAVIHTSRKWPAKI